MYYINAVRWCPYLGQGKEWSEDDTQAIFSRPPPAKPAEVAADIYIPPPLEAPERATRNGLVYTKGQGFGLPAGACSFALRLPVARLPHESQNCNPLSESGSKYCSIYCYYDRLLLDSPDSPVNQNFMIAKK